MINILALALLVSSLAAAGVWSPLPDPSPSPAIGEARRIIVVEYERQIPSPPPPPTPKLLDDTDEKFQEVTSDLHEADNPTPTHSAKEKVSDMFAKAKKKVSDGEHLMKEGKEKIIGKTAKLKQEVQDKFEEEKGKISSKASHLKEEGKSAVEDAVEGVEDVVGNLSRIAEHVHSNLSDIIGWAKDVAGGAVKHAFSKEAGRSAAAMAHLVAFTAAYGTGVWVTFVSSYVLATALPRQQFGMVQSKMYPVYFRVVAYGVGVAALAQWFGKGMVAGAERVQGYNLLGALGLVLLNMLYLEPKATKVMFERMKMEKEEGRGRDMADIITEPVVTTSSARTTTTTPANIQSTTTTFGVAAKTTAKADQEAIKSRVVKLSKRLKKLNTYSSFLNLLSLMGLTWHLVHLAGQLQVAC